MHLRMRTHIYIYIYIYIYTCTYRPKVLAYVRRSMCGCALSQQKATQGTKSTQQQVCHVYICACACMRVRWYPCVSALCNACALTLENKPASRYSCMYVFMWTKLPLFSFCFFPVHGRGMDMGVERDRERDRDRDRERDRERERERDRKRDRDNRHAGEDSDSNSAPAAASIRILHMWQAFQLTCILCIR
jgi:hypothetical protein